MQLQRWNLPGKCGTIEHDYKSSQQQYLAGDHFVILNFPLRSLHFSQMQEYPSRKLLIFDASAIWRPSNKETLSTWRCKNTCTNVGDLSIKENNGLLSVESSGFSNIILKISKFTAVCRRGLYWHKKATGACWVISGGQSSFVRHFISNISL